MLAFSGHEHPRVLGALGKVGATVTICLGTAQNFAVRAQPGDFDARDALAAGQRTHKRIGPFACVLAHVQPKVADVEVGGLVFTAETVRLGHHGDVDAGLLECGVVLYRNEGDAALIRFLFGDKASDKGALGHVVEVVQRPGVDGTLQAGAAVIPVAVVFVLVLAGLADLGCTGNHLFQEFGQLVGLDLEELDVHFRHVHRGDRQAAILCRGQHHALAGEVEGRSYGGGLDGKALLLASQLGARPGHQPGQHAHHVAGAGLDVGEEQQARVFAHHPGASYRLACVELGVLGLATYAGAEFGVGVGVVVFVAFLVVFAAVATLGLPRQGRHFQHLQEGAVVGLGVQWQAERKRQRG